ncbi:hypothetical protein AHF37_08219 [Paragonimus kellicotti]|nr:hypothetical protein AHF37_08219 [Paragonimus kellicotti]
MCKSCESCIRMLMIVFNILFTVIGLAVLAAGLYFYFTTFGLRGMDQHNILAYTFVVIAVIGALSVVLGILGCCGSYHYSRCLLGFYFALLLLIFAAEIAIGVAFFVYRDQVRSVIHETLKQGTEDRKQSGDDLRWMDTIQFMFSCCGYNGQLDYGTRIPATCCKDQNCNIANMIIPSFPGCKHQVDNIMHNYFVLCIAVVSIAFVELIGLIFAMTLFCAVRGRDSRLYYEAVQT